MKKQIIVFSIVATTILLRVIFIFYTKKISLFALMLIIPIAYTIGLVITAIVFRTYKYHSQKNKP